jgi:heptosyltransferase-3
VAGWLGRLPFDNNRLWIGVGPGSKMPAKRWPEERFREVMAELIKEFDVWPVVFGGAEDAGLGDRLLSAWGHGYNAAGALSLRGAAAALRHCAFLLTNDTGTMHLAAAVGTRCVAIFSARHAPGAWNPYGKNHRVFQTQIECEGCLLVECVERKNECLTRIPVGPVMNACKEILQQNLVSN